MSNIILDVRELTTRFLIGKESLTVVDKLSFQLEKGKTLAIVGESGCGKSISALSLMRILPKPPALEPEGEVLYQGENLLTVSEKRMRSIRGSKISMIFQDPMSALNPVFSIGYQLLEVIHTHLHLYGEEADRKAIEALKLVGIDQPVERMHAYPHQLSGGMKQRVMIAMAMLCEPDILIADEPTTALDVTIQAQILELMRELQRKKGMAILLITHDMGVVAEMADEVMVMYASWQVEKAEVHTLFEKKAHPYTEGLFASRPQGKQGKLPTIQGQVPPLGSFPQGCHFHPRCPKAIEACKTKRPPTILLNANQQVRCWLYEEGGVT